jgi:hypothetical protein
MSQLSDFTSPTIIVIPTFGLFFVTLLLLFGAGSLLVYTYLLSRNLKQWEDVLYEHGQAQVVASDPIPEPTPSEPSEPDPVELYHAALEKQETWVALPAVEPLVDGPYLGRTLRIQKATAILPEPNL